MGGDYIMHFLTLPWKLIFAFVPPTAIYNGYVTFVISILFIGGCTAVIGDIASHLGCFIFLKHGVNAIAFVALGTSVPDTFASKTAAIEDETADASVGNVTGSNAVNVFLGIGIAWTMAAIYHAAVGTKGGFQVPPGSLGFSVTIFVIEALLAIFCSRGDIPPLAVNSVDPSQSRRSPAPYSCSSGCSTSSFPPWRPTEPSKVSKKLEFCKQNPLDSELVQR